MAYGIGPISGAHLNPAVTVAVLVAGRIAPRDAAGYIGAQLIGGIAGAGLLVLILLGRLQSYDIAGDGLGQNGRGQGYGDGFGLPAESSPSLSPPCCSRSSSSAPPAPTAQPRPPA